MRVEFGWGEWAVMLMVDMDCLETGEDRVDTSLMSGKASQAQVMGGQPELHTVLV